MAAPRPPERPPGVLTTGLIAIGDRAWLVPRDRFVVAWNESPTLDAAARVRELAGGAVPRWAVLARALEPGRRGVEAAADELWWLVNGPTRSLGSRSCPRP